MFCPQCGQQQVSDEVRFCSRCGFPLNAVSELLLGGGALPSLQGRTGGGLSPRQRGVRQGAMLMLSCLVLVPVVIFVGVGMMGLPGELIPLTGALTIMGGLLRILYAVFFENPAPTDPRGLVTQNFAPPYVPPAQFNHPRGQAALPPQPGVRAPTFAPSANTAEMVRPPSVTDHTTRLLKDEPDERGR